MYAYYFSLPEQILGSDTWAYFNESVLETDKLKHHPILFFADFFYNQYNTIDDLFTGTKSFWNDLKTTVFVKFIAVLNLLSFKNYFINILFFNLIFLLGLVCLYKLINKHFVIHRIILVIAIFLMPSFLFWCSGIHKDGVVFSSICFILYQFDKTLDKGFNLKSISKLLFAFLVLFLIRNYILLLLCPILFSWFIAEKYKKHSFRIFSIVFLLCLSIFILSSSNSYTKIFSSSVVQKHHEFLKLEGNTKIITPHLTNTPSSLLNYLPFALKTVFLRPHLSEAKSISQYFAVLENYFILCLSILSAFFITRNKLNSSILLCCFYTSILLFIFIGYTVCFNGAIVRYRSSIIPITIIPYLLIIFGKLKTQFPIEETS